MRLDTVEELLTRLWEVAVGQVEVSEPLNPYILPEEALQFEPSTVDVCDVDLRFIYLNSPLKKAEQQWIHAVRMRIAANAAREEPQPSMFQSLQSLASSLPVFKQAEPRPDPAKEIMRFLETDPDPAVTKMMLDMQILRFLYSTNFDVEKTAHCLRDYLMFRNNELPVRDKEPQLRDDLQTGAIYWHGRDRNCRPVLLVRLDRLKPMEEEPHRIVRLLTFCFEFCLRYATVAGRVENWVVIVDCEGKSASNIPPGVLRLIIETLTCRYRGRLFRMYIVNFPGWLGWLSNTVLRFVPGPTSRKVRVLATDWESDLRRLIAPHQLEEKYGGSQPNLTEKFYPFHFFPGPFEPDTPPQDIRTRAQKNLHERIPISVVAGTCWIVPPGHSPQRKLAWISKTVDLSLTWKAGRWLREFHVEVPERQFVVRDLLETMRLEEHARYLAVKQQKENNAVIQEGDKDEEESMDIAPTPSATR